MTREPYPSFLTKLTVANLESRCEFQNLHKFLYVCTKNCIYTLSYIFYFFLFLTFSYNIIARGKTRMTCITLPIAAAVWILLNSYPVRIFKIGMHLKQIMQVFSLKNNYFSKSSPYFQNVSYGNYIIKSWYS